MKSQELIKKQIITILWGIIFLLNINYMYIFENSFSFLENIDFNKNLLPSLFIGLFSTLILNAKYNINNFKTNLVKIFISVLISFKVYFLLILSSHITAKYLTILVSIVLIYYYVEIKNGKNLKNLILKTASYMSYVFTTYFLLAIFFFSFNSLILKEFSNFKIFYFNLYIIVTLIFFILFQEDKKDYKVYENDLLIKIFKYFFIALIVLIYINIFMYGKMKFYIVTHFIFWTGYLILIINLILKSKKIAIIMLPLNIVLIYKISERINELGLTEGRYFILFLGVLLLIMYLLQIFNPKLNEEKYIILILFSIFSMIFIPKINAFDMSRNNLSIRANKLADLLKEKLNNKEEISIEEADTIRDYFYYFEQREYEDNFMNFVREYEKKLPRYSYNYDTAVDERIVVGDLYGYLEKLKLEGENIRGYNKIFERKIYQYNHNEEEIEVIKESEDYILLEKIFKENKSEIIEENRKIIIKYANISYNSKLNLYMGEAEVFILVK